MVFYFKRKPIISFVLYLPTCGNFEIQKSLLVHFVQNNPINTITPTPFTKYFPAIFCFWIAMIKLTHFFSFQSTQLLNPIVFAPHHQPLRPPSVLVPARGRTRPYRNVLPPRKGGAVYRARYVPVRSGTPLRPFARTIPRYAKVRYGTPVRQRTKRTSTVKVRYGTVEHNNRTHHRAPFAIIMAEP